MTSRRLTRREAIQFGLGTAVAGVIVAGCTPKQEKAVGDAVGQAMVAIGGLTLLIPHWLGKLIGVALTLGGSSLIIYFAASDGTEQTVSIDLTEEQKQKIQQAVTAGDNFVVTDPKGKEAIAPKK